MTAKKSLRKEKVASIPESVRVDWNHRENGVGALGTISIERLFSDAMGQQNVIFTLGTKLGIRGSTPQAKGKP